MKLETTTLMLSIKSNAPKLAFTIFSLLAPIKWMLLLVGLFIFIDTIFGIYTAKKTGKQLTSRKLSKFISKMFVYQTVVILAYAIDKLLLGELILLFVSVPMLITKLAALALVVNETFSIDEKLKMINKEKGLWFYFKQMLGLARLVKKESGDLIDDINK